MALIPLESNPDVMTKFIHQLGVPSKWTLVDVYGLDQDVLAIVPKPTLALILLYPHSKKAQAYTNGRKPFPINNGPTTKDKLLENAAKICSEYMARDPDELGFTMIALAAANE
ncbi:hypothetical protein PV327_003187 [Microctonus hyperodae]|uniref:Ubiquitin carboxyl-terminal hydrolase n=1 Tax=Microctonus hyperodae TaxID=165561 RepID=A0AA39L0T8_MICHY|nr:hypothetical protein PV327_003187 [Microctonus hyperodae]